MTDQQEFPPEVVEAVARAIVGPWLPVPDGCQFTLDQLRDVRWRRSSPQEQGMARTQALAALRTLRGLGGLAGPGEVVVPQAAIDQAAADMFGSMKEGSTKETAKAAVRAYLRRMNALLAAAPRAVTEGGQ